MGKSDKKKPPYGILAAIAIIAAALCAIFGFFMGGAKDSGQREKLEASACISTDRVVEDQLRWLDDVGQVTEAIQYFYDRTGVQPYLLICSSLDGKGGEITDSEAEEALKALYDSMYGDEGHMIYAFMEYADSQYITWIYTGRAADAVIDSDAREMFLNNADRLYTDRSLTDDEYFTKTFEKSADQIMADKSAGRKALAVCIVLFGILAAVSLVGFLWLAIKDARHREREQLKDFLDAPIGQSQEMQELENKYQ